MQRAYLVIDEARRDLWDAHGRLRALEGRTVNPSRAVALIGAEAAAAWSLAGAQDRALARWEEWADTDDGTWPAWPSTARTRRRPARRGPYPDPYAGWV
jgi:hypothetical protein